MRPKSAAAQSILHRYKADPAGDDRATQHDKRGDIRYAIFARRGPMTWVRTGSAPTLAAAQRHAEALGGEVQARRVRTDEVVKSWLEGEEMAR